MASSNTNVNSNKMPADKKSSKKTTEPTTQVAATTAPAKVARKASAKAEVTVPVVTSQAPVDSAAPAETVDSRTADAILSSLQESLKTISAEMTTRMRAAVATALEASKAVKRELRSKGKRNRKDPKDMTPEELKVYETRRANNAFLKLRPLSDELCTFMGLPSKSQKSQTDVTKFVANYVKTHNCFDPNFKRRILPDTKLAKLLRAKDKEEITYLNLQRFLKVHFLKPAA
jgi:chromatin remodeling complex protein RSC6